MRDGLSHGPAAVSSTRQHVNGDTSSGSAHMPIAVIGMGCRFAGSATTPDSFWQMLSRGQSGWSRGDPSRFKMDAFYHPAKEIRGAFNAKGLYLLKEDIAHFDNQFFNISSLEAKAIDPQQRLMLEVAFEAFENAGIPIGQLSGSETGVYCAVCNHDYEKILSRDPEVSPNQNADKKHNYSHRYTGTGGALVSNRISYHFNLNGPSITLDTACSGSLVAVHEACKALRSGEISQALVGGTNLILDPEHLGVMSSLQFLSDHGRCYSFDSRADGLGRGEGVAAIILKPLSAAIRDGDPIQSIIRGSAVNQDGQTPSVTMPSADAQVRIINKAYREAGLDPRDTCYVEAHGTGTQIGDKLESSALAKTFCHNRRNDSPLYVGSVKTNIGHTECVSGLAGLIKSALALQKGMIPANLNFSRPNDQIPLSEWQIIVPKKTLPWPQNYAQRASINNFGYGGTNAHVILESTDSYFSSIKAATNPVTTNGMLLNGVTATGVISNGVPTNGSLRIAISGSGIDLSVPESHQRRRLYVFTHSNERGMSALATNFKTYLQMAKDLDLSNLAFTLAKRRSHLAYRTVINASSVEELVESLDRTAKGTIRPRRAVENPKICFVFTGQGAQWAQMGQELLASYPVFARSMTNSDGYLMKLGADWSLLTELSRASDESRINEAIISQPCCTALQIALVELLRSWSICPETVCGHSSGEIAAAYAAGYISASDALKVAFFRGQSMRRLKEQHPHLRGGMVAAGLSADVALLYINKIASCDTVSGGKVVIACINSPQSVTLSGDISTLRLVQEQLERDGIFNRSLAVEVAYHSHHMLMVHDEYVQSISGLQLNASGGQVRMISSVTGKLIDGKSLNAEYWAQNMTSTVRFSEALSGCVEPASNPTQSPTVSMDMILEIGPHAALAGPIKQTLKAAVYNTTKLSYYSVLTRKIDAVESAVKAAGELLAHGVDVRLKTVNDPQDLANEKTLTTLPSYNWQHAASHWSESRQSKQYRLRKFPRHDLLGISSNDSIAAEPTWRNYVSMAELPWLSGHVVDGQAIFPASGFICMALEALRQTTESNDLMWKNITCQFRQIVIDRALLIPEDDGIETFFTLRQYSHSTLETSSWREFRIYSITSNGESSEHCHGLVFLEHHDAADDAEKRHEKAHHAETVRERIKQELHLPGKPMNVQIFYEELKTSGLKYTGPFASITRIHTHPQSALCHVQIPDTKSYMPAAFQQPHVIHPSTLDSIVQTSFPALLRSGQLTSSVVVSGIDELSISSDIASTPGVNLLTHSIVHSFGRLKKHVDITVGDVNLRDPNLIAIKGLCLHSMQTSTLDSDLSRKRPLCNKIEWAPDITCSKDKEITRVCQADLPEDSHAKERSDTYNQFIYSVIKEVISAISPQEEILMALHHQKLLKWMKNQLQNAPSHVQKPAEEHVASFGIEGVMLTHVSHHLVEILIGQVDPLSVLMKDDLLFKFYSMVNIERCHIQLMNYLRRLKFKNPRMRVLEIGAGTGSTSIAALDALQSQSQSRHGRTDGLEKYVFSDISSGFFEKAKEKLAHWDGLVEFKKLDAEAPMKEQGFEEGSFDLIIASNVLHATQTMSKTMKNVRSLLKPNGKLALVEITEIHMLWHIIVGTLPGWWLGAEDGRVDSPLLSLSKWDRLLQDSGFAGSELVMKDYESAQEHQVSLIISSATSSNTPEKAPPVHIVGSQDQSRIVEDLSRQITSLEPGRIVTHGDLNMLEAEGKICVILLELQTPFLAHCDEDGFQKIQRMLVKSKGVLWVTSGAAIESNEPLKALITGLGRTIRSEDHGSDIVTLDLQSRTGTFEASKHIHEVLSHAFLPKSLTGYFSEYEYAVRNGQILIPRVVENQSLEAYVKTSGEEKILALESLYQPERALALEIQTPGMLGTLYWTNSIDHDRSPTADEVRVEVSHLALNFKDLMNAMGKLAGLSAMLIECSGTIVQVGANTTKEFRIGDRICAIRPAGLATTSNIDYRHVQRIPSGMSAEDAAALLISYGTAFYSLREVARMKKGESILIHAVAGALGQAAIALAQYFEAGEIFVTAGSIEKRKLIMEKFGIPEERIFSSRTLTFAQGIRRLTNGRGVDVVLNSLGADATRESQNCIAQFGRFIELGKKDLLSNARMETQYLEKNAMFAAVDFGLVAEHKPFQVQEILSTVLDLVASKKVQTIFPVTIRPISALEGSFREMQTGKHTGKIVLQIDHESKVMIQSPRPKAPKLRDDCSYLVVGGLGGIGKAVVRYLAKLGAKHIATLSRSREANSSTDLFVSEMLALGVNLAIHKGSVTEIKDINRIKELAVTQHRPIRGIIQGAMVLQDSSFSKMTYSQWKTTLQPKVTGTLNLQNALGESLDFFVLLSSDCGVVGTYGQSNYSAASTFQDAFARHLAHQKFSVRTIDLGVVGSSGYTAENEAAAAHVIRYGVGRLTQEEFFVLLNDAISHPIPPTEAESQVLTALSLSDPAAGTEEATLQRSDPKFSHVWVRNTAQSTGSTKKGEINISANLLAATTQQEAIEAVQIALVDKLARLLGLATGDINIESSASSYGMDYLISVELRNWVGKQLESHVQTFELMSAMSIQALSKMITERSRLVPAALFHAKEQ